MYYDDLLKLCGYEIEDIENVRPRLEKAFKILEFTPEDFNKAEQRVKHYYDVDLLSIRKMLGIWFKSLIDLVLAKEDGKKVVYTSMPPYFHILNGLTIVSEDVYVTSPDITLAYAVGGIFGKLLPYLEEAERDVFTVSSASCSPIELKLGAINLGAIPLPDLCISSGHVCDQTPKLDEILNLRYGTHVVYADGTHDEYEKVWPNVSEKRVEYVTGITEEILQRVNKILGCSMTKEIAEKADLRIARISRKSKRVFELIKSADPQPTGFVNVGALMRLAKLSVNSTTVAEDIDGLLELFYDELQERIKQGKGNGPKGKPRVGISGLSSIPEPTAMIEEAGLAIVVDFTGLAPVEEELVESRYEDYWSRGAETMLRHSSGKYSTRLIQVCREWNLDGAILNPPIGCRELCRVPLKEKELIQKQLGKPSLILECDLADTRTYSDESLRTRLEAFVEMLKAKQNST
ncbi:MAG: 2-hydroxyacyl-CoA dehydratase family protein [Dehalococcoidia bacterium]